MYAVVEIEGNQYIVEKEKSIRVDRLNHVPKNKKLSLEKVLLYHNKKDVVIGTPYIQGASVQAEYVNDIKDKKVVVFKYKKRKRFRKKKGHKQPYSVIKVIDILLKK
ncbi:MAG: 50S ribosomal protein L21 [Spirochaetes bacterium]|nr:50S ribosomal protein L21 [Spirochaetota bacterium]